MKQQKVSQTSRIRSILHLLTSAQVLQILLVLF